MDDRPAPLPKALQSPAGEDSQPRSGDVRSDYEKGDDVTSGLEKDDDVSSEQKRHDDNEKKADSEYYMSGTKLHVLICGLALAVFIMALVMSILTTAIPKITEEFQSTEDIGWYVSGYLLTLCSLQPLSGKIYTNFSLKWSFMAFFFVFEVGSLISGAATSSPMLIIGRAIAGAGAAGLMSGTLSIVAVVVPLQIRPLYIGALSSLFGVALIAGPLIGGAFTEHVSWRWVFYINLPVGGLTIAALVFFFDPPARAVEQDPIKERIRRLDIIGAALFIPAIAMILMALQWGGVTYPWSSGRIIGLFVGAGAILIIFILWQWRVGKDGMLPYDILLQRTVLWAALAAMFAMGAQIELGLWIPEWFQVIKGASPTDSGVRMLPAMLGQVIASIISGALITQLGYANPWIFAGTVFMSIGCGLFTTFEVSSGSPYWIGYQVIFGLGAGMFLTAPLVAIQAVLSPEQTPVGISTIAFFQMFGGALGGEISQTIFNERLLRELAVNVPGIDVEKLLAAGTSAVRTVVSQDQLPGVLQSYNTAILVPFYFGAAITGVAFFCTFGMEWVSVKGKNLMAAEV